jgi:hypothetical protein
MVYNNRSLSRTPAQQAILTTLLYSDIFSFPLTKDELWKFLIAENKISHQDFERGLQASSDIVFQDGYYCLQNKEATIAHRQKNLSEVTKKMKQARFVAEKLSGIPSVLFIGVSGGLAVGNVTKEDDVDLVIIVRKNTLFVSRLMILGVLEQLGIRRVRNQKNTADTICVNLLLDETALDWFGNHKDIYTAREIAQILPIFEREDMYQKFLSSNAWIGGFLPNFMDSRIYSGSKDLRRNDKGETKLFSQIVINSFFELLSRLLQLSLIKRHQTSEIVTKHVLAFHPNDYRVKTLKLLRLKMRHFGLLTKL